jgi:hypothetical protein
MTVLNVSVVAVAGKCPIVALSRRRIADPESA